MAEKQEGPAAGYKRMRAALDAIGPTYERVVPLKQSVRDYPPIVAGEHYIFTHLRFVLFGASARNAKPYDRRSQGKHVLIHKKNVRDYRIAVPSTIKQALDRFNAEHPETTIWAADNVTATWVACYLHNIHPDETKPNWEHFECSHRCAFNRQLCVQMAKSPNGLLCVEAECLVWESKSDNQARGTDACTRLCKHEGCGRTICECQEMHLPCCP